MVSRINIVRFLELAAQYPVFDVRSPGEYQHAHIPGAYSLPLFTDDEHKVVGTTYKQQSRENAIKVGLDCFGPKMRRMVEEVEAEVSKRKTGKTVLVHCWRGGMRSGGVAWLLDLYGFKVMTLEGGYKSFRTWVLKSFETAYPLHTLGGYTGTGKTAVLKAMAQKGQTIIDLEGLAHHRGSAFGALGQQPQPTQEMFENRLATELHASAGAPVIWVEDESRRIGNLNIPAALWPTMRSSPLYFLEMSQEDRLENIMKDYGKFKTEDLAPNIMRIRKRLGGLATKEAMGHLVEGDLHSCFGVLLTYYDKFYKHDLESRDDLDKLLTRVPANTPDAATNAAAVMAILKTVTTNGDQQ